MSAILIKNAEVYSPKALGTKDILIINNSIVAIDESISLPTWLECEVIDAKGKYAVPGFIDAHVHITGGGGEAGFSTEVPPVVLSTLIKSGITTVGGLLGTDTVTRSVEALLAKAYGLDEEGVSSFIVTGGYPVPSPTITGSVRKDIALFEKIRGCKVAIADHRVAPLSAESFHNIVMDSRIGGMLCDIIGMVIVHVGNEDCGLESIFKTIEHNPTLARHVIVTHINHRTDKILEEAIELGKKNGYIDITSGGPAHDHSDIAKPCNTFLKALKDNVPLENILMSSDGNGSMAIYADDGSVAGLTASDPASLHAEFVDFVKVANISLSDALLPITQNVANAFSLEKKGRIEKDMDADVLLLDKDLEISTVIAKGRLMMRDRDLLVKGKFEK